MDVIDRVDQAETPLYTMAKREIDLNNTDFAWTVDTWPTVAGAQGVADGVPVADGDIADNSTRRRKMGNGGQAFRRVYGVGWIADRVPKLPGTGKGGEIGRAAADAMVAIKQDIEAAFCSEDQVYAQDDGTDGGTMAGLGQLTNRSNTYTGASSYAIGKIQNTYVPPAAAALSGAIGTNFNLAAIRTMVKALRRVVKRNRDYVQLCGLELRQAFTGLTDPATVTVQSTNTGVAATQTRSFTQQLADAELGITIDVVRTDYGRLLIVPTDFIGTTTTKSDSTSASTRADRAFVEDGYAGYTIPREKIAKRWGVPFTVNELAQTGAGTRKEIKCYLGLVVYNPSAFGSQLFTAS